MTLQNEHILMAEAHRRVAQRLADAEVERFGRRPRRVARAAVASVLTLAALVATLVGVWAVF